MSQQETSQRFRDWLRFYLIIRSKNLIACNRFSRRTPHQFTWYSKCFLIIAVMNSSETLMTGFSLNGKYSFEILYVGRLSMDVFRILVHLFKLWFPVCLLRRLNYQSPSKFTLKNIKNINTVYYQIQFQKTCILLQSLSF